MAIALRSQDVRLTTTLQEFLNLADKFGKKKLLAVAATSHALLYSTLVYAAGDGITSGRLTDVFATKSFQGSWSIVNGSFNWAGGIMNYMMSAICFLGLCAVIWQRMLSLGYLGARGTFDEVYDTKKESRGSGFFGMKGTWTSTWQGSRATGLDAIIRFIYSLLPDLKSYSDFNPDRKAYNLTEDDGPGSYILKTAIPTVMMIFLFTIGFSGTLSKSYGVIVDGLAAAADKAVSVNLEAYVKKALSTGESYQFTIGGNGTPEGKLAQNVAEDIYSKVLSRMDIIDTNTRLLVGKHVEQWVYDNVLGKGYGQSSYDQLSKLVSKGSPLAAADNAQGNQVLSISGPTDAASVKYDVVVNTLPSMGASDNSTNTEKYMDSVGLKVPLVSFIEGLDSVDENGTITGTAADGSITVQQLGVPLYAHVIFRKTRSTDVNYFIQENNVDGN